MSKALRCISLERFYFADMGKKKIAILANFPAWLISDKIPAKKGHYAVWLVSLYERFSKETIPYEIHWVSLIKGIKGVLRMESCGQNFHFIPCGSRLLAQRTGYIFDSLKLKRELNIIKPDLIHAWGTEGCYAWATRKLPSPKLLSMQGVLTAIAQRAKIPAFEIRQAKLEKKTLPYFSCVTAESQWGVDRCKEIAPGTQTKLWEYAANEPFFHTNRNIAELPICLFAGSDTHAKNVPFAIRAFSRPELSHITLYLAGISPDSYPDLPQNIVPLGRVSRERMRELLAETWCLVHPSLADSCPNIVKEARVMGIPAIVTTECGAKQYVVHEKSGYVIPCDNVQSLVNAVLKVTKTAETCLSMGSYDQERCRRALSADTMYTSLMQIYESLL